MKRGKVSLQEKWAIKNGVYEGKTVEEIAGVLDRSETCIKRVIKEYDELIDMMVKAKMEGFEEEPKETEEEITNTKRYSSPSVIFKEANFDDRYKEIVKEEIFLAVVKKLNSKGISKYDVSKIINKSLAKALKNEVKFGTVTKLYNACIKEMKSSDFILKKTEGGNEGVAVMTGAASKRKDDSVSKPVKENPHIYKPFGN